MTTNAPTKTARLLGTTDAAATCDLCGRTELKRTVVIEFTDTGEIVHAGTDCAARALGWAQSTVRTRARSADDLAYQDDLDKYERTCRTLNDAWEARYKAWLVERFGSDNDGLQGPLVSRPRERVELREAYRKATGDRIDLAERPQKPAHLRH